VEGLKPTLIIVTDDAAHNWPSISRLLDGITYQRVLTVAPESVWMRAGAPAPQVTSISAPGGAGASCC